LANQKIDANGIAVDENPSFSGACTCGLVIHLASSPPSRTALRGRGEVMPILQHGALNLACLLSKLK
ncbi:MAG: hypothetical protein ACLQIQ_00095, partial [Beijerinckiaceae bacterium]